MNSLKPSKNQLTRIIVLCLLLIVLMCLPSQMLFDSKYSVCIHYKLFSFECPLCGMTRAVYQLLHLHFILALQYNFVVALLPFYLILDFATLFFKQNWLSALKKLLVYSIAIAFFILYTYRIVVHFNWI